MSAVLLCAPRNASSQLLVDCHGDTPHPEGVYLEQLGQKLDHHGDPAPQIVGYTQGMFPEVYALDDSRIAWVFPLSEADPATGAVDLGKVWCEPVGEEARLRTPTGKGAVDTRYGFLDGRLAAPVENVAGFTQEWHEDVWPDIDIVLSSNQSGPVLYFVCHPGSHPEEIRLQFHGQDSLKFVDDEVRIYKENQWIRLDEATAYQIDDENEVSGILNWTANWEPNSGGGTAGLVFEEYDPEQMVVFKVGYPQMPPPPPGGAFWSTYMGGTGGNDFVTGMHTDDHGDLFACGHSPGFDFPNTVDIVFDALPSLRGFLIKFDDEHAPVWRVYLGPSARCLAVDGVNRLVYVAGGGGGEVYLQDRNTSDPNDYYNEVETDPSWIACMSYPEQGAENLSLVWATRFSALVITAMAVQDNGDLWMTGRAGAGLEQVEPVVGNPWMQDVNYDGSAFIAHFDAASHLQWSTWIGGWNGGSNDDWGLDIAVDEEVERAVVVGVAGSDAYIDESCTDEEPVQHFPAYDGGHFFYCNCGGYGNCTVTMDGFIALFNLLGERETVTFFGGANSMASSVAFDPDGNIYVAGVTSAQYTSGACTLPTATEPYMPHCQATGWFDVPTSTASGSHYLARFSPDLDLEWSTLLNAAGLQTGIWYMFDYNADEALNLPQVDVDELGAVYFAASTYSGSWTNDEFPIPMLTNSGYHQQSTNRDNDYSVGLNLTGQEVYVAKFSPSGAHVYGSYYGGTGTTLQYEYYMSGGDVLCELKARFGRLYIAGATNTFMFMPLADPGPAYLNWTPPNSQDVNSPDQWNGFIANLGTTYTPVGIPADRMTTNFLSLYPSPAEDRVTLAWQGTCAGFFQLRIYDAVGREVMRSSIPSAAGGRVELDVSQLATGSYVARVTGGLNGSARFLKN